MPNIGDEISSHKLGYKVRANYIWTKCDNCGIEYWTRKAETKKASYTGCCKKCSFKVKSKRHINRHNYNECLDLYHPKENDVIHASKLGYKMRGYMFWNLCPDCNKGRWVQRDYVGSVCVKCKHKRHGDYLRKENNHNWKGGIASHGQYISVLVDKDNPYYSMSRKGYILQHRLVMAEHLKRPLESWEIVHHKNRNKKDNRLENLELLKNALEHTPFTIMERRIKSLEDRITILEAENILLKNWIELNQCTKVK